MAKLLRDLRHGVLVSNPVLTSMAVLTLVLGIGLNAGIFVVVDSILFKAPPYDDPTRLVWLSSHRAHSEGDSVSPPDFDDWRRQSESFEDMAAFGRSESILTGQGEPERILSTFVTSSFFSVLRANARLGRTLSPEEEKPGNTRVVVLSNTLWQRRFASDSGLVGRTITLNGNAHTVVGVMPATFQDLWGGTRNSSEMWIPRNLDDSRARRENRYLRVVARLKSGTSLKQAQADMDSIASTLEQQYPDTNMEIGVAVTPLNEKFVGNLRPVLTILLGVGCGVLLLSCATAINLPLVDQNYLATHSSLGKPRRGLTRQLIIESIALAVIGGGLGLALALWGLSVMIPLAPDSLSRLEGIGLDERMIEFTLILSAMTGSIIGLFLASRAGRYGSTNARGSLPSRLLVLIEISVALVLLLGAGLMIKSFILLQEMNPGFNPENLLTMELSLPARKYAMPEQQAAFYQPVIEGVNALPGVQSAATATDLPLANQSITLSFRRPDQPLSPLERRATIYHSVSPGYFQTMGIPLIRGRDFTDGDSEKAAPVLIINQAMASRYFPDENPVGKQMSLSYGDQTPRQIVGEVADVGHPGLGNDLKVEVYAPQSQIPFSFTTLVARSTSEPGGLAAAVRNQVQVIDKDQPVYDVKTMKERVALAIAQPRFQTLLLSVLAAITLLLAAIGTHGLVARSVYQHASEMSVFPMRARWRNIGAMVLSYGMAPVVGGLIIGMSAAFVLTHLIASWLYQVSATDPSVFTAVPLLLIAILFVTSYISARSALTQLRRR